MTAIGRVHFGSLEGKLAQNDAEIGAAGGMELDKMPESIPQGLLEQQAIMKDLEKKKIKHTVNVPTDDFKVRQALRDLALPVTYFGEGSHERRNRLKDIVAERLMAGEDLSFLFEDNIVQEEEKNEEFFSYGPEELGQCRRQILEYSIPKAVTRREQHEFELNIPFAVRKKQRHEFYNALQEFESKSLQFGDDRPMGFCRFSPNSKLLATSSWSGVVKMWNVPESEQVASFKGHRERISGLEFHPGSTISQSPSSLNFVSGASDGSVYLWSLDNQQPIGSLVGHEMRVARVAFHPSGRWIGTARYSFIQ